MSFSEEGQPQENSAIRCNKCDSQLLVVRRCTEVFFRCQECGERFEITEYAQNIDDSFEEDVAFVPMDRI